MIILTLPYDAKLSKNAHSSRVFRRGRFYKDRGYAAAQERLATELLQHRRKFLPNRRTYLGVILHRTHARTDPQNLVEFVADAVSTGIAVGDHTFTIVSWPVDISKKTSSAFITIWLTQERGEYLQAVASESVEQIVEMATLPARPDVPLH